MYGRGAADMKCGFAAALAAVEALMQSGERLAGDLLLAGVIDEEWESAGAAALTERWRADASVLVECTGLDVVSEHGGFAWYEIESRGVEAAGVDPGARRGRDRAVGAGAGRHRRTGHATREPAGRRIRPRQHPREHHQRR